ncbi:daunorubicin resistance protein DrrA family ABC transporter ATP-binding protein [Iodidimonas muriae]|uniref:Daunorubicin resistance protein DrrA family ABC transporter ATP-binding protein n=1 Tax=Iodidimonas muriae TaxID=261467 RepID=A0ABQ2LB91_9PROT|nr:ATP-binding cassette domain-containing protein [Iodidimonas muriae]GER08046.1 daunorubicin resistance protein DrrA family ABC transporter ATP-binding protein [Kordiimonadales bacterium JCM 17843]GGO09039.1 daunorubicin resistance protein DrrA family ABC transporter ATP-binding protein [Iodidimonas muriae]
MTMIDVKALVKTYPGQVEAVRGIDFNVKKGRIFGLLGPNGAGKSSTIRMLATLSRPTSGRIRIDGKDAALDTVQIRRTIGYVAQASAADAHLTGLENLMLQGRLFGLGGAALRQRAAHLLALFDLEEAANRRTKGWSGGMRRRLDLAMGLVHGPRLLLLDEPSAGLDPHSRAVMWREVERLAEKDGITILLSTHYLEEADRLADEIAIIDKGRIVATGTPHALKDRLRGDLVSIRLRSPDFDEDSLHAALAPLPFAVDVKCNGPQIDLRVDNGSTAMPALMAALAAFDLQEVSMSRASLDDVYLAVTGKPYEPVHSNVAQKVAS